MITVLITSKSARKTLVRSMLLNGVIFLLSSIIVNNFFPEIIMIVIPPHANPTLNLIGTIASELILHCLSLFWIYPIYIISTIMCIFWNADLANIIYKLHYGEPIKKTNVSEKWKFLVGETYNTILGLWYLALLSCIAKIPYFGSFLFVPIAAWFYAFSSFDYKWSLAGLDFCSRLKLFETQWEYMLGFGLLPSLTVVLVSKVISVPLLAFFSPMFISMAMLASTRNIFNDSTIPIFWGIRKINLVMLKCLFSKYLKQVPKTINLSTSKRQAY